MKKAAYINYTILLLISFIFTTSIIAQSPGGVSIGLTAWFKADALPQGDVTNWTTSAGSLTIALTDPALPYAQSTNGSTSSNNYFNYNQYVSFLGNSSSSQKNLYNTGSFQLMANDNVATSQSSFFGVYQKSSVSTTNDAIVYWRPATGNHGLQCRGWGRIAISSNLGSSLNSSRDFSPEVPQTILGYTGNRSSATSMVAQKNATTINAVTASNATGVTGISMGARLTGASPSFGEYFAGNSGEVIFYNTTLPTADVTKVNTYLAIKYGITLASNYVSPSNTTIFTNVAPYNKNIIGIGRDDASALIQKQSHNIDDSVRVYKGTLNTTNAGNTEIFGANESYIVMGANTGKLMSTASALAEIPVVSPALYTRLEREWKVTNTNFNVETFNIDLKLTSSVLACYTDVSDFRLLVDDDGDFSNATVYAAGAGLTFSYSGNIVTITGVSNTQIPLNSTKYITIATINSTPPPSAIIATSTNTICEGSLATFTVSTINEGSSPTYQWELNGNSVSTSTVFSSSSLTNGDVVSFTLTSNAACISNSVGVSNSIIMVVTNTVIPSVQSAASVTTICEGTTITFTATPTNGGTSPAYQWQINGTNAGTGSVFFSSALNNGDIVSVILNSNENCAVPASVNSNSISIAVTPTVTPSVLSVVSSNSICSGDSVIFIATPANGGTSPVYQWQINGSNVGVNSSTFTTSSLNNGDIVSVILTSNAVCVTLSTASSNGIVINVTQTPIAAFSYLPTDPSTANPMVTFNNQSTNSTSWLWTFDSGVTTTDQNPSYNYTVEGVYTVTLTAINGACTSTVTQIITVSDVGIYFIPNVFTPNGDSINDIFGIVGEGISEEDFSMLIYNRWGQLVFDADKPSKKWDGSAKNGGDTPNGTYVYVVNFKLNGSKDLIKKVGNISLFR